MNKSTIFEKLLTSVINGSTALIVSIPFYLLWGFSLKWKLATIFIFIFFLYQIVLLPTADKRDVGMLLMHAYWQKPFTASQYILLNVLYSLSFATVFFHIWFPFDLLLINLLLIQLPFVLTTGYTFHGYASRMLTVKK